MTFGLRPYAWGHIPFEGARDFFLYHGDVEEAVAVFGTPELLEELSDGRGGVVGLWRPHGWPDVDFLGFKFDAWVVLVYDYRATGPGEGPMTAEVRAEWASRLNGQTTGKGYLVLSASEPLIVASAGAHPSPMSITLYSALGHIEIIPEDCEAGFFSSPIGQHDFAHWCDASSQFSVIVTGTPQYQKVVFDGLTLLPDPG